MDIKDLISPKRLCFDLKAESKEAVIEELIEILDSDGKLYDKLKFKEAVFKREEEFSTGIGMGIAVPHGKDNSVKEAVLTFGNSIQGIDYNSMDGEPAHIFFLISVPESSSNLHLQILASISRQLMHENVREALKNAKSYEEVVGAFNF